MSNDKSKAQKNAALHKAKKGKNDEFYTQLPVIESELGHYEEFFRGKTVLCNCDDPRVSNFFKYFALKFKTLGLKRIITTCYKNNSPDLFSQNTAEQAVYLIYDGNNGESMPDWDKVDVKPLKGDGDFRSKECIELLKQADIVVTNPPFSLFREYVAQLIAYNKKFLIIGNQNAITYKEIFPLIKENKIWIGCSIHNGDIEFMVPNDYNESQNYRWDNGNKYVRVRGPRWFTNLDYKERHDELILYKRYNPEDYPKYDNYDAINVDKTKDIPCDYDGVMGVPITFLDKYCPEQFEIVEFRKGSDGKDLIFSNLVGGAKLSLTSEYSSVDADSWIDEQSARYGSQWQEQVRKNSYSATSIPGMIKNTEGKIGETITYARILIRKLK